MSVFAFIEEDTRAGLCGGMAVLAGGTWIVMDGAVVFDASISMSSKREDNGDCAHRCFK